jgi:AraC-like DNA-binding protein
MVAENVIPLSEIAKQVGCTRERLRQLIQAQLGLTGKQLIPERRIKQLMRQPLMGLIAALEAKCSELGLSFGRVMHQTNRLLLSQAYINGRRVLVRRMFTHNGHQRISGVTMSLQGIGFVVCGNPQEGRWLVMPADQAPKRPTMFAPNGPHGYGTHGTRHDFVDYLDAWHLLLT